MSTACRFLTCLTSHILRLPFYPSSSCMAVSLILDGNSPCAWDWELHSWLDWSRVEANTCNCHCAYSGPPVEEATWGSGNLALVAVGVIGIILVCTNTAWAFKISFKDLASGENKELFLGVKGKSKGSLGIYGASRGLQLTG